MKVSMCEVKIAWVQRWLDEHPIQARVITKKLVDQNEGAGLSGGALYEQWSVG